MPGQTLLSKGYNPLNDKSKLLGKLDKLSPVQREINRLMVADETLKDNTTAEYKTQPPIAKLKSLSDIISNNIQAQTDLRSITPYIKRAEQIWVTLLLKPNGLEQELLRYETIDTPVKNANLHAILLQTLKSYFSTTYPFENTLPDIVKDVMFRTGSYAILNLSHSALDHLINGMDVEGVESLRPSIVETERMIRLTHFVNNDLSRAKNKGWIRKEPLQRVGGVESIFDNTNNGGEEFHLVHKDLGWTFTDNPIVLKVAELRNKVVENKLDTHSGVESLENLINNTFIKKDKKKHKTNNNHVNIAEKKTFEEIQRKIYPERNWKQKENLFVRKEIYYTGHGKGVGTTYHIPSEACIPVHLNGEKDKPIGFILLTEPTTGEFLKSTGDVKFYSSNKNRNSRVDEFSKSGSLNNIISNLKNVAQGKDCNIDMDWAVDMVNGLLEKEIVESFLNGDKAAPVSISLTEATRKLYLSRALKQQGVRSIFVPASSVTYFALDYTDLGVGKSLVDEAKSTITRLAILNIADTLANLENAVSKTLLTVDLEEENFAPQELINQVRENYLSNNPSLLNYIGFNNSTLDQVIDGVKNSLVRIKVNAGDNRNIINPNIEESQDERVGIKPVDTDSLDRALNELSSRFDLKRSWLEDSEQGNDFAIEALADQELLMSITLERSRVFSKFITEHFIKHIKVNEVLLNDLIDIIKENKKLYEKPDQGKTLDEITDTEGLSEAKKIYIVLNDFLNNLDVTLPIPASVEQYNKISDKLDAAEKLVTGWKDVGISEKALKRLLTEMGLEDEGDENSGTNSEYVIGLMESILRKRAYRDLGISIPFDEIISEGKEGGMMTFITEIGQLRENTTAFLDEFFNKVEDNKKIKKVGKKHQNKDEDEIDEDEDASDNDDVDTDDTDVSDDTGSDDNDNEDSDDNNKDQDDSDDDSDMKDISI